jgi:hypothetical protein
MKTTLLSPNLKKRRGDTRTTGIFLVGLALVLVGSCWKPRSSKTPAPALTVLRGTAPQGFSLNDLGRPFDENFQRLQGEAGASLFPKASQPVPTPQNLMKHELVIVEDENTFAANASAWGVEGKIGTGYTERYASYRAMIIRDVYEIDDTTAMRKAPKNALFYPIRIYYGHIYEVTLSGSEEDFNAGVAAELKIFNGGIERFAKNNNLTVQASGRGLKPTTGRAIFARTQEEIEQSYLADGQDAVPIIVEWRVIPNRSVSSQKIEWKPLEKNCAGIKGCEPCKRWGFYSISYTAPRKDSKGNSWDGPFDSVPDLVLSISAGNDKRTTSEQSTFEAYWEFSPPLQVDSGEKIKIYVQDHDVDANDFVAEIRENMPQTLDDFGSFRMGSAELSGYCIDPPMAWDQYEPEDVDPESN